MTRKIKIIGVEIPLTVLILIGVFAAATVFTAVEQAVKGAEVVYLEKKAIGLEGQNKELASKLVMDSSLAKVNNEASRSGMIKPEKIVHLGSTTPVVARAQ